MKKYLYWLNIHLLEKYGPFINNWDTIFYGFFISTFADCDNIK